MESISEGVYRLKAMKAGCGPLDCGTREMRMHGKEKGKRW